MKRTICRCHAYKFPHTAGGGKCGADACSVYCQECGLSCSTHSEDHGIGGYDYCGATGFDSRIVEVSDCCGAEVDEEPPAFKPIAPNNTKPTIQEKQHV